MEGTITITVPKEIETALEEATREEGVSQSELIKRALADYLFVRKFRSLRERLMSKAQKTYTDQEIFDIVS